MEAMMFDTTVAELDAPEPPPRKRRRSFDHATMHTTTVTTGTSHQDDNEQNINTTTIIITTTSSSSSDSKKRIRSSQEALMVPFDENNDSTDPWPSANVDGSSDSSGNSEGVIVAMQDDDDHSTSLSSKVHPQYSHDIINSIHPPPPRDDAVAPANLERPPPLLLPQPSHHRVSLSPPPLPKQPESLFKVLLPLSSSATPATTHSDIGHGEGGTTGVTRSSTTGTTPDHFESRRHDVVTRDSSLPVQRRHWGWWMRMMIPINLLLLLRWIVLHYWLDRMPLVTFQLQHRPIVAVASFPTPLHRSDLSSSSSWFRWFRPTLRYQSSKPTTTTATTTLLSNRNVTTTQPLTLRQVLQDEDDIGFHLAMAPAFFGFYGYFGMLSAWYDVRSMVDDASSPLRSVAGASAGAMAAILIATGIHPRDAMNFCANITVDQYADFPGLLALFRGNLFEQLLHDFLLSAPSPNNGTSSRSPILFLQDARIPVAVTAFDIQTMTTQILFEGPMARAARASATFPGLFQPVGYRNYPHDSATTTTKGNTTIPKDFLLIDGGVWDMAGTMGLTRTMAQPTKQQQQHQQKRPPRPRVINLCVGSFRSMPGPDDFSHHHPEVISISMMGLPQPGPWAMSNGPLAYDRARDAMRDALDIPLVRVDLDNKKQGKLHAISPHYQLVINV